MAKKIAVVVDHDAGTNPDDIFALLLLLNSPGVDIKMTISGNAYPVERAQYAHHFLSLTGYNNIPCFSGEENGHINFYGHDVIKDTNYEPPRDYMAALKKLCEENHVIYVAIQGLSNLYQFITAYPDLTGKLDVYHMGITLKDAENDFITGGTNIAADPVAAKHIYERQDIKMHVVGSHTTINDNLRITPDTVLHQKIANSKQPHYQMAYKALLEFHEKRGIWPALHDPLTASAAIKKGFVQFHDKFVDFHETGTYKLGSKSKVSISESANYAGFMDYFASIV